MYDAKCMLSLLLSLVMITSETKSYICFCFFFFEMRDVSANVVRTRLIALCNTGLSKKMDGI